MPYFQEYDILFIHIPKTGGSSVELYFENKLGKPLNKMLHFYSTDLSLDGYNYQHANYVKLKELLLKNYQRHIDDIENIFTVIRNPYERVVSDLFYFKWIQKGDTPDRVAIQLKKYFTMNHSFDNHKMTQKSFLIDEDGKIPKKIRILHTEYLTKEMQQMGYNDFDIYLNSTFRNQLNYYDYLNEESIQWINHYFREDFETFGFSMKGSFWEKMRKKKLYLLGILFLCFCVFMVWLFYCSLYQKETVSTDYDGLFLRLGK
jgi:hypothetical protein